MSTTNPTVNDMIARWEKELRSVTNNRAVLLVVLDQPHKVIKPEVLFDIICEYMDVQPELVKRRDRHKMVSMTRQLIFYFSRIYTALPLSVIGKMWGGVDHSTVIHGRDRIQELLDCGYPDVVEAVFEINSKIKDVLSVDLKKETEPA